jgi:hypothetical protein
MKMNSALLMTLLFIMHSAHAAQECTSSLTREINNENMNHYKALVQKSLSQKVSLDKIDITQILSEGRVQGRGVNSEGW